MPRTMITALTLAVLAYAGMCAVLFALQRSLIYLPRPFPAETVSQAVPLPVDGAQIRVTVRPGEGPGALVYFGGNAEIVPFSVPELAEAFPGRTLYLVHYRGYGGSTGSPSEAAFLADGLAVYDMARRAHDDIALMGRSLGSAVATYVAARRPASRLVLVTPFDSLAAVAARHYPIFPVRLLLRDRFEAASWAPDVGAPTLILAAGKDEIVPLGSSERLRAAFGQGIAAMRVIEGAGHNDISLRPEYMTILRQGL